MWALIQGVASMTHKASLPLFSQPAFLLSAEACALLRCSKRTLIRMYKGSTKPVAVVVDGAEFSLGAFEKKFNSKFNSASLRKLKKQNHDVQVKQIFVRPVLPCVHRGGTVLFAKSALETFLAKRTVAA
jgi:hypothetical protein